MAVRKCFEGGGDEEEWQRRVTEADEVPPGCEGLIFLPYLQGERAPVWDADARGVFFGVRSVHDHRHFTRACLEGVSYSLVSDRRFVGRNYRADCADLCQRRIYAI